MVGAPTPRYGKLNQMETPDTLRARELKEVYHALGLPNLAVDERLDILLHVKFIVQEFDSKLCKEVVGLLNREADLLLRGQCPAQFWFWFWFS